MTTKVEHIQMSPVFPTKTKKIIKKIKTKTNQKLKPKFPHLKRIQFPLLNRIFPQKLLMITKFFRGKL